MKNFFSVLFFSALFLLPAVSGFCTPIPIDISSTAGWKADPGVTVKVSTGVVDFSEQVNSGQSFFNMDFLVDPYATFLTFDYTLKLGANDSGDFLQFDLQDSDGSVYSPYPLVPLAYKGDSGSGSIDLTAYRRQTVALIWTLGYGDAVFGTTATLSNIRLDTAPIPEPSTILLIGLGLMALANRARKE